MPDFQQQHQQQQQKITKHTKKQENMTHLKELNGLTETVPEAAQILDLLAKAICLKYAQTPKGRTWTKN